MIELRLNSGRRCVVRAATTDILVVQELFIQRLYFDAVRALGPALSRASVRRVLDLGANVGLAAACFRELFPQALICCVEPEQENFEVLKINAELLGNVSTVQGFVGGEPGTGYVRKPDTGGEWGFFLSREAGLGSCQTARVWTVSELLREPAGMV